MLHEVYRLYVIPFVKGSLLKFKYILKSYLPDTVRKLLNKNKTVCKRGMFCISFEFLTINWTKFDDSAFVIVCIPFFFTLAID